MSNQLRGVAAWALVVGASAAQAQSGYPDVFFCADKTPKAKEAYESTRERLSSNDRRGAEEMARAFWKIADAARGRCKEVNWLAAKLETVGLSQSKAAEDVLPAWGIMAAPKNGTWLVPCQPGTPYCTRIFRNGGGGGGGGGAGSGAGMIVDLRGAFGTGRGVGLQKAAP